MRITVAQQADIPELCRLLTILFSQEADFKPDQAAQ
ncbi:MAG: GNAT family N-acetyltransferase, partial [Verrucomicrobia bacterium]|nr:GNAT family N-acetyltransferase [Deltaproteobacteria bacterium]